MLLYVTHQVKHPHSKNTCHYWGRQSWNSFSSQCHDHLKTLTMTIKTECKSSMIINPPTPFKKKINEILEAHVRQEQNLNKTSRLGIRFRSPSPTPNFPHTQNITFLTLNHFIPQSPHLINAFLPLGKLIKLLNIDFKRQPNEKAAFFFGGKFEKVFFIITTPNGEIERERDRKRKGGHIP